MQFALTLENPLGDAVVILSGTMPAQLLPRFALKVSELQAFIPQLNVLVNGHTLTQLDFYQGHCSLKGEPVHIVGEG
jgi:hypothetical protein